MKNVQPLRLGILLSFCFMVSAAHAQYVPIPDSAFAKFLQFDGYSSCLTGNGTTGFSLDTTCYRVTHDTNLDISSYANYTPIHDLTGLRYFKNLRTLYCTTYASVTNLPALPDSITYIDFQGIGLSTLPHLPDSLQFLNVGFSQLTSLPALPQGLKTLYCNNNHLRSIPPLPDSLHIFQCYLNKLTSLPALPARLISLDCSSDSLTSLPGLPRTLTSLNCGYNPLTSLPTLSDSLHTLYCSYAQLSGLPALPAGLTSLYCANNNIGSLPVLPDSITIMYCGHNSLHSLPALPAALKVLFCDSNQLDSLPSFPSGLTQLHCNVNHLTSLPLLPAGLYSIYCRSNPQLSCLPPVGVSNMIEFYISGTAITCMPNRFTASNYDIDPSNRPICVGTCYSTNFTIAIPDSNFGHWLYTNGYASCMTGNGATGYFIDTSAALVRNADTIDCSNSNIRSLQGVFCFRHLRYLNCSNNPFAYLTNLQWPQNLTYLDCSYDQLTDLYQQPTGLLYLKCAGNGSSGSNGLTGLPHSLPSGLRYLDCSRNAVGATSFTLPDSLRYLDCSLNSNIYNLPAIPSKLAFLNCAYDGLNALPALPAGLTYLDCNLNGLHSLGSLPDSLRYLDCSGNAFLDSLPSLPVGLISLHCSGNPGNSVYGPLRHLPALPASLVQLNCSDNQITNLPALPVALTSLICDSNQLTSIPSLSTAIDVLRCTHNTQLACLPAIYRSSISSFRISSTHVTCLANPFSASDYDVDPASMPLCGPSSGCPISAYQIRGNVHNDTSVTCMTDSLAPGSAMPYVKVILERNGQMVAQSYTDSTGAYSFGVMPSQAYTVRIDTTFLPLTVVCPGSNSYQVTLTPIDTLATGVNFGLKCYGADYGISTLSSTKFKPGDTTIVNVIAGNPLLYFFNADCGPAMSGTIMVTIDGPVHYAGPAPGALTPSSVSGDTLRYNVGNLDSLTVGSLYFRVYTDTSATIGTPVCISGIITPVSPDFYPSDDTLSACLAVVSSFDPNHKVGSPEVLSFDGDWLTYTVEFQNTGNAPASVVVVRDTLSSLVQAGSFRYIASSHNAIVKVVDRAVEFTFPNINLIESMTDPIKSIGWVQYKVRSTAHLPLYSQINNTAYIYFDYNPAIVTNTTTSTVGRLTGILPLSGDVVSLYPNPNRGSFTLQTSGSIGHAYTICDMLGHIVSQEAIVSDMQLVSHTDLAPGVYTLMLKRTQPLRFIVVK